MAIDQGCCGGQAQNRLGDEGVGERETLTLRTPHPAAVGDKFLHVQPVQRVNKALERRGRRDTQFAAQTFNQFALYCFEALPQPGVFAGPNLSDRNIRERSAPIN